MRRSLRGALAALVVGAVALPAQGDRALVQVTDVRGNPIPFAYVQIVNGVGRVADDSGRAAFTMRVPDSLNLQVRRIGFDPFTGWIRRDAATGGFTAELAPLPNTLDPVTVSARANTPLARTGFYDRAARIQRGAFAARVITPEELDFRNPIRLTQVLQGDRFIKVQPMNGKSVLQGRGVMCAMTILLDGQRLLGTYEEAMGNPNPPPMSSLAAIDDIVSAPSIAAIEVYGSAAAVPAELQRVAGSRMAQGCGLIAIWTGPRK